MGGGGREWRRGRRERVKDREEGESGGEGGGRGWIIAKIISDAKEVFMARPPLYQTLIQTLVSQSGRV